MSNFKRDRFFIKINLREDVWKQNLRILLRFTETPGISNKQTRKLPLLICLLEMLGVFVNFTKMRNFCLQTSSNRIILKEMRSLLEFEDIGFRMAIYCHPYQQVFQKFRVVNWKQYSYQTFSRLWYFTENYFSWIDIITPPAKTMLRHRFSQNIIFLVLLLHTAKTCLKHVSHIFLKNGDVCTSQKG